MDRNGFHYIEPKKGQDKQVGYNSNPRKGSLKGDQTCMVYARMPDPMRLTTTNGLSEWLLAGLASRRDRALCVVKICQKSRLIGCVIPRCMLRCRIMQPATYPSLGYLSLPPWPDGVRGRDSRNLGSTFFAGPCTYGTD